MAERLVPLLAVLLIGAVPIAQAATIHFGTPGDGLTSDGISVADGTGNNSLVTVSTLERQGFGDPLQIGSPVHLSYWSSAIGPVITSGVFAPNSSGNDFAAEITLTAVSGPFTLQSFSLGRIGADVPRITNWRVYNSDYSQVLLSADDVSVGGGVTPTLNLVGSQFHIQWAAEAYFVVANDIVVTSAPVPLPAAGWLLISGIGALGGIARRRQKQRS
jgi:hypothetical protein